MSEAERAAQTAMSQPRVLVVDDDPLALKLLDKALSLAGYEVVKAGSGAEALRPAGCHPPRAG